MEPSFDSWTLIFLLVASQGFLLSILIMGNQRNQSITRYLLGCIIFLFSLILVYCVLYWTNYLSVLSDYLNLTLALTYIIGPLMLFLIRSMYGDKFSKIDLLLHGIPYITHTFLQSLNIYSANSFGGANLNLGLTITQNIHLLSYGLVVLYVVNQSDSTWIKRIGQAYFGYTLSFFSYYVLAWSGLLELQYDYMISMAMSGFIYFVGYYSFHKEVKVKASGSKYANSELSLSLTSSLSKSINEAITKKELFLNSSLKLADVANEISSSTHLVSQVINSTSGSNFSDFINRYRVEYAIELMSQNQNANAKLISIAYDSGFGNKVSFINAFKKIIGETPGEYRKSLNSHLSIAS